MTSILAFDAYGTLFDVHAAASRQRDAIGASWERLSQLWRQKHLEYTWIHSQTGRMVPFWRLAGESLDFAIASVGGVPEGVRAALLQSYRRMPAFAEVGDALRTAKQAGSRLAIVSNGDPDMLADAIEGANFGGTFDAVLSVAACGAYKPDMRVYRLVTDAFAVAPEAVTFFSSNRWDIAGAHVFGMRTCWVNRSGAPDEYPDMPADEVRRDLAGLV
jgi:2-haloacid dehalogenase